MTFPFTLTTEITKRSGALEAPLRALVQTHGLTITGKPSIAAYNQALRQAKVIDDLEWREVDLLGAWRNRAAHGEDLDTLTHRDAEKMAQGVTEFLQKHP